jgi:uncharacterized protein DUF6636
MTPARIASALCVGALVLAGCGGGSKTVTETRTETQAQTVETTQTATTPTSTSVTTTTTTQAVATQGKHGPHYFETPSHNIGCFLDTHGPRCDVREHTWSPPPEPAYCIKAGVDWGGGIALSSRRAAFVCAGDTTLGGPSILAYGHSAQRGPFICDSEQNGVTCRDTQTGHGFFLSRQSYRIF